MCTYMGDYYVSLQLGELHYSNIHLLKGTFTPTNE